MGDIYYYKWEEIYLVWLQHLGEGSFLQSILLWLNHFFSGCGEEIISILILGCIYWGIDKKKALRIGLSTITATVTNGMIKNLFRRLRPYQALERIKLLRELEGYSFPSGHSANAASLYGTIAYEYKKVKWLRYAAFLLPLFVAVSRNYLGAHWPTDVLVGLLQGTVVFLFIELAFSKIMDKKIIYAIVLLISLVGIFYCKTDDYYSSLGLLIGFITGTLFEEKWIHFENSRHVSVMIRRTLAGGLLFIVLNPLTKLMLGYLFAEGTPGSYLMRVIRYGLVTFILIGIYPYFFRFEKKAQTKKEDISFQSTR